MFNDPATTSFLIAERQARLRHEAEQHRLAWLSRRGRRAAADAARAPRSARVGRLAPAPAEPHGDDLAA